MQEHKHNNDFADANTTVRDSNQNRDRKPYNPRWQNDRGPNPIRSRNRSFFRAGQIFSVIYHLSLLAFAYNLVQNGEQDLAFKILAINAALVAFAFLLSAAERKFSSKPQFPRRKNYRDTGREKSGSRDNYRSASPQRRSSNVR